MSVTTSPQIQLKILQHQLHLIDRKKTQSRYQWMLLQDVGTLLLVCTISTISVTLVKKIVATPPPQQELRQMTLYSQSHSLVWNFLQYPSILFCSVVVSFYNKVISTIGSMNGSYSKYNNHSNRSDDSLTSRSSGVEKDFVTDVTEDNHRTSGRPKKVVLNTELQQRQSENLVSSISSGFVPTTVTENDAHETEVSQLQEEQDQIFDARITNDDRNSATTGPVTYKKRRKSDCKYLEILVHNVSHTDLVLGLDLPNVDSGNLDSQPPMSSLHSMNVIEKRNMESHDIDNSDQNHSSEDIDNDTVTSPYMKNYIRPRFSSFDLYCRLVLDHLTGARSQDISKSTNNTDAEYNKSDSDPKLTKTTTIINFPRYHRSMIDPRYSIRQLQDQLVAKKKYIPPKMAPTGIQLSSPIPLPIAAPTSLQEHPIEDTIRIRGRDAAAILSAFKDDISSNAQNENLESPVDTTVSIKYVFFPLLATLLPVWYRQIKEKEYQEPVKRVLILVTGVGTPRNYTHSIHGNSTEACADLMKVFVSNIDSTLSVVKIFSDSTNIFRTDENIIFCERELMPLINAYRNAHVMGTPYPDDEDYVPILDETSVYFDDDSESDWRTRLHVTLSFADGSPARTQAIQSSLRTYKPTYFHFWQLKTFWHESKIVDDDIEVHSFATMESIPAIDTSQIRDPYIQAVVTEMRAFYEEMITALNNDDNDIDRFWLRKSHKPVLAVLLVQSSSSVPTANRTDSTSTPNFRLYRGTNMEVSMPTGSLCAERNAIGSALAMNPNLKRHDLKMIAVLAVPPLEPRPKNTAQNSDENTIDTVRAPTSNKSAELGDRSGRINENIRRVTSYSSILEESIDPNDDEEDADTIGPESKASNGEHYNEYYIRKSSIGSDYEPTTTTNTIEEQKIHDALNSPYCLPIEINDCDGDANDSALNEKRVSTTFPSRRIPTEPVRRIPLFPKAPNTVISAEPLIRKVQDSTGVKSNASLNKTSSGRVQQKTKRTVVVQSHKDLNPLSPCGACNEWIKKIAQCNPYFKIITFTDANCNGMYISPCQD